MDLYGHLWTIIDLYGSELVRNIFRTRTTVEDEVPPHSKKIQELPTFLEGVPEEAGSLWHFQDVGRSLVHSEWPFLPLDVCKWRKHLVGLILAVRC